MANILQFPILIITRQISARDILANLANSPYCSQERGLEFVRRAESMDRDTRNVVKLERKNER